MGYRLSDVARYFGRNAATVGTLLAWLGGGMEAERKEKREIDRLVKIVES
jgi:hypothetical protein